MTEINDPTKRKVLKVLLLEDDAEEYFIFSEACKKIDYPVAVAHLDNPAMLMDHLRANRYDLLFLDLNMPVLSGLECLEILREHKEFESLPVVILTGTENKDARVKSAALGVQIFMIKPYSIGELADMIAMVIPQFYN